MTRTPFIAGNWKMHKTVAEVAAIAWATAFVPAANGSSSNAPIGPFQKTVPAAAIVAR